MTSFVRVAARLLALSLAFAFSTGVSATGERPNVLLILADDLAFGDLEFAGGNAHTPNLNALAKQGVFVSRFHASPVCSITRSMVLTGNDPHDIGLGAFDYALYPPAQGKPGYESVLTPTSATIAELMSDAGYNTYMVGKWHLGGAHGRGQGPAEWGFKRSYGIYTGGSNHWNRGVFHIDIHDPNVMKQVQAGIIPEEAYYEDGEQVERPIGIFSDDLYSAKLFEFMADDEESDAPFLAYVAFTTPHAPIQAPSYLIDKYVPYYLEKGFAGVKRARFEAQQRLGIIPADAVYPEYEDNPLVRAWSEVPEADKQYLARSMATYAAMIESQDIHIGKIMDYLRETGELDNTLIIYMSDNGPEGVDSRGPISNPMATQWITSNFSLKLEDVGAGNAFAFIGTDFANAVTGGLTWWKWFIGEGGVRTPLIVVPPKSMKMSRTGEITNHFVSVKDLPATILDYAGVDTVAPGYKGREIKAPSGTSLRGWLEGERDTPRTAEQYHAFELFGNAYVVQGDYKAIRVRPAMWGDGEWHLYNIVTDPGETTPLETEQPEQLAALVAIYEQHAKAKGIVEVSDNWSPWIGFLSDEQMGAIKAMLGD